jgi:hypothetical protein
MYRSVFCIYLIMCYLSYKHVIYRTDCCKYFLMGHWYSLRWMYVTKLQQQQVASLTWKEQKCTVKYTEGVGYILFKQCNITPVRLFDKLFLRRSRTVNQKILYNYWFTYCNTKKNPFCITIKICNFDTVRKLLNTHAFCTLRHHS